MKFVILTIPFRVLKNRSLFIIFSCIVHFKYDTLWYFNYLFKLSYKLFVPIPVAARSKAWVRSRGLLGLRDRILPGTWMSVVSAVCCHFEVCAAGRPLVQRTPTDCGVSECDLETSTMRSPLGLSILGNIYIYIYIYIYMCVCVCV